MAFLNHKTSNNAQGQLLAGISASAGTLILQSGQGALFPAAPFRVKLEKYDTAANGYRVLKREICLVTAVSSDTLTITRSYENCPSSYSAIAQTNTAFSFDSGDTVSLVLTAGQIKDVQDELSRLEVDKLDNGALRTGLTAKRVLVIDASGNETQLTGASGQVIGFDGSGTPVATTPSTDINGLTSATTIADADSHIFYANWAGANRKISHSDALPEFGKYVFGDGSDGSLAISSGTTALTATNGFVIKQYQDLTISGTATLDLQGEFNVIYVRGTFTMSAGLMTAVGRGGAGGATTGDAHVSGSYGRTIDLANLFVPGSSQSGGASATFILSNANANIRVSSGAGGSSGRSRTAGQNAGTGGAGGGAIVIIANKFNFTGGTINASGAVGTAPTYDGNSGGGGWSAGTIAVIAGKVVANAGTLSVNGGAGTTTPVGYTSGRAGGGGAGGYWVSGGGGGNAGANGTAAGNNAYGTGGAGGIAWSASAYTGGAGGGGAPGAYYVTGPKIS